ncbi:MAG: 50S ribosomal protein L7/L12 [bacterium]|jgi:large subunit ribosomal protein L7/L12|nr:50S ribosomal protein L7/L12 [bacterium]
MPWLAEIVGRLKDCLGISAAAPAAAPPNTSPVVPIEGKASFDVELTAAGPYKVKVIGVVREITGLGLRESKELVESAPAIVEEGLSRARAEAIEARLSEVGAIVTLK